MVVFPEPFRAKKPEDRSFSDRKRNVIDSRERTEPLRQAFNFNHRLIHKNITKIGT